MINYYYSYLPTKTLIKKYLLTRKKYMLKHKKSMLKRRGVHEWNKPWKLKPLWKKQLFKLPQRKYKALKINQKPIARKTRLSRWTVYNYRWFRLRGRIMASHMFKTISGHKELSYFEKFNNNNTNWNTVSLLRILDTNHPLVSLKMGFNLPTFKFYDSSFFLYKRQLGDWKRDCFNSIF